MNLFGFMKKEVKEVKATCGCGSECGISDIEQARVIVLGACCNKATDSYQNVCKAMEELGHTEKVLNIDDVTELAKYGVMSTPALVIDSKVITAGNLITVEQAKKYLENAGYLDMSNTNFDQNNLDIKVLGSGCKKCELLEVNTKEALASLNIQANVSHVKEFDEIAKYGVMSTPALVINNKVVSTGKVLTKEEVVKIIK